MFHHLKDRKLYRSPKDALVFGICAGVAQYVQVDPVFMRLLVVAVAFLTNVWPVVIAYGVAVFLVPIDPAQDTVPSSQEPKDVTHSTDSGHAGRMDENQNM